MSPGIGKKTPKNGNKCKFLNFKVTHFKKIKGVGARLKNDLSQKKTLLPKGIGRYAGKTATVQNRVLHNGSCVRNFLFFAYGVPTHQDSYR
jgi:hypothetical protein